MIHERSTRARRTLWTTMWNFDWKHATNYVELSYVFWEKKTFGK